VVTLLIFVIKRNLNTGAEKRFLMVSPGPVAQFAALPKSDEPLKGKRFLANPIVGVSEKQNRHGLNGGSA